jgi:hypothetical protein
VTTSVELIAEIERALKPAIIPAISGRESASDLYEAYLLTLIVQAAKAEGATVTYRSVSGSVAGTFVFRTSPGLITSTARDYTFVRIDVASRRGALEAHLGVRVSGKSRVLHEGDVILLLECEAMRARSRNLAPRSHSVLFLAEAKFYASSIPLGAARGYIGLCTDLSVKSSYLASNTENREATRLLDARGYEHEPGLVPKSGAADRFIGEIRKVLSRHRRATR